MDGKIVFEYFYGQESDMLSFYRIPKLLFTNNFFASLSTDAKVLYGLMLDRMSLSLKNKWFDKEKRAYIYFSVEETMEMLHCKKNKAIGIIKELDAESGIGLIEKKRQGQGKPTIIYVKSFMAETNDAKENVPEVGKINLLKLEKQTSRSPLNQRLEVGKTNPINDVKLAAKEEKIKVTIPELNISFCEDEYQKELRKYIGVPMFKSDEEIKLIQKRAQKRLCDSSENVNVELLASNTICNGICDWIIEKPSVDLNGNVYFCCMNNDHSDGDVSINFKIGNVCETDFSDIWNGWQYKKIREIFYNGRLPEVCVGCQFLMNKLIETVDIQVEDDMFLTRRG